VIVGDPRNPTPRYLHLGEAKPGEGTVAVFAGGKWKLLPQGANGQVLTANAGTATRVTWQDTQAGQQGTVVAYDGVSMVAQVTVDGVTAGYVNYSGVVPFPGDTALVISGNGLNAVVGIRRAAGYVPPPTSPITTVSSFPISVFSGAFLRDHTSAYGLGSGTLFGPRQLNSTDYIASSVALGLPGRTDITGAAFYSGGFGERFPTAVWFAGYAFVGSHRIERDLSATFVIGTNTSYPVLAGDALWWTGAGLFRLTGPLGTPEALSGTPGGDALAGGGTGTNATIWKGSSSAAYWARATSGALTWSAPVSGTGLSRDARVDAFGALHSGGSDTIVKTAPGGAQTTYTNVLGTTDPAAGGNTIAPALLPNPAGTSWYVGGAVQGDVVTGVASDSTKHVPAIWRTDGMTVTRVWTEPALMTDSPFIKFSYLGWDEVDPLRLRWTVRTGLLSYWNYEGVI
jgi:hypothetical protein